MKKKNILFDMIIFQMALLLNCELIKGRDIIFSTWYLKLSTKILNKCLKNWIKSTTLKISGFNKI